MTRDSNPYHYYAFRRQPDTHRLELGKFLQPVKDLYINFTRELHTPTSSHAGDVFDNNIRNNWEAIIVAVERETGNVVGYGSLRAMNLPGIKRFHFDTTYVTKEYRGRGIYKNINREIVETARSLGAEELEIRAIGRKEYIDFLLQQGFNQEGSTLRKRL